MPILNNKNILPVLLLVSFAVSLTLHADTRLDLGDYQLSASYPLPPGDFTQNPAVINAHEVSAVSYNWDNNSLFVIGDEGGNILEVSLTGELLSRMVILGFNDPEGITYTGNNTVVIVEERYQNAYEISYQANSYVFKNSLTAVNLGEYVDNIGLEGISYDPRDGSFVTVKEKSPQLVSHHQLDFANGSAISTQLFTPNLGVADIADVQLLSTLPSALGTELEDQLLLFSQESSVLLLVSRSGQVLSQFSFDGINSTAEGVTIDPDKNIYIVAENGDKPMLYVLSPPLHNEDIPLLPWWAMLALGSVISWVVRKSV